MNYYKHHLGDFIKKTLGLTATERGVYRLMLDMYYISEAPLPLELVAIYRSIGAESRPEKRAVEKILATFFEKTESGFVNARCEEEIQLHRSKSAKARQNGEKGAGARWQTPSDNIANAKQTPSGNDSIPSSHKPITNSHREKERSGDDFELVENSEWRRLVALLESIRRKDPDLDPTNVVSDFDKGHLRNLYFGYGFDRLFKAIDEIGQLGWYVTTKQLKEYLSSGKLPTLKGRRPKQPDFSAAVDPNYHNQEGDPY